MNKYTRSFSGAFFGAALAIWPAATWDMSVLLLFGGVSGWLLGYHGDRLIGSIVRGYAYARRISFRSFLRRTFHILPENMIIRSIVGACRHVVQLANYVASWFRLLFLTPIPFTKRGRELIMILTAVGSGIAAAPRTFARWWTQHPINQASTLRFFAGVFVAIMTATFFWWLTESGQRPGDVITKMSESKVLTANSILWEHALATGLLTLILVLATILVFSAEFGTKAGYYGVWNRYERFGKIFFFLEEIVRFQYLGLWLVVTLFSASIYAVVSIMAWSFLVTPAYFGIVYAFRLAWRAVRLNRDYGIISLGVSLIIGVFTFFAFREELVTDPVFRLAASLAAGLVAGLASVAFTWVCGAMFRKSSLMRRIALKRVYVEKGVGILDPLDKILPYPYIWKYWKLSLPSRIRAGCAAIQ